MAWISAARNRKKQIVFVTCTVEPILQQFKALMNVFQDKSLFCSCMMLKYKTQTLLIQKLQEIET
jgi:hypothetical protein